MHRWEAWRGKAARLAVLVVLAVALAPRGAWSGPIEGFALGNGMQVVVIPDHRAPVVTHMVWYRVGAADDPTGKSGLAHFLEHLMFKATAKLASGEFTRILTRLGARHNALTNHDTTSYFQRIAKEHLRRVMELEADRMAGLRLNETEVATERDVIREERRSSVDASPIGKLNEQMLAQLYQNHPYGRPVLGWAHEMGVLTLQDARQFYARHYAPNNAVLVVAGDVTAKQVRDLAEATYGRLAANPAVVERARPVEPDPIAARSLTLEDAQAGPSPIVLRYYHVARPSDADVADAQALQILTQILGADDTSRLYRRLVIERKLAVQAGADYQGGSRDSSRVSLLAVAGDGASAVQLAAAMDDVVADVIANGVTDDEVQRAKRALDTEDIYEADNIERYARRIGEAVTSGRSLAEIQGIAARRAGVSANDVRRVATKHLEARRSVTGAIQRGKPIADTAAVSGTRK